MMEVIRAVAAGACYGVQRALDMAFTAAGDAGTVESLGPLIHNPQVVGELADKGIRVIDDPGDAAGDTVIIRSHGVGPADRRALASTGVGIVDATCPHVLRAQKAAVKLAEEIGTVIVVGDPEHPEVDAIREYAEEAGGSVRVVDSPEAIPDDIPRRVGVVVQTTQNRAVFERVLAALEARGIEPTVKDTICSATAKRQSAARDLAAHVDAMVVIGGHNSSNTTRLYEICKAMCPKTYHIETIGELDASCFAGCATVGITAGASTPEAQIVPVQEYLERL